MNLDPCIRIDVEPDKGDGGYIIVTYPVTADMSENLPPEFNGRGRLAFATTHEHQYNLSQYGLWALGGLDNEPPPFVSLPIAGKDWYSIPELPDMAVCVEAPWNGHERRDPYRDRRVAEERSPDAVPCVDLRCGKVYGHTDPHGGMVDVGGGIRYATWGNSQWGNG